jgi:hypothetical protein
MKTFANLRSRAWLGAVGVACCLALTATASVRAEDVTAKTLVDRAQVLDLITHYYYNFGRENPKNFSNFYADDAELILGDTHYKGKDGIMKAYSRGGGGAAAGGAAGEAPAAAPVSERPKRYSFNVTISNPLIVVHGDTANAQIIFTEYVQEKQGDTPKLTAQGREYSTFLKVKGQWRYKTRQIKGGNEPPEGWKE